MRSVDELAKEILHYSRQRLTKLCPLLLLAVYALEDTAISNADSISTDGIHLYYNPAQVIQNFSAWQDSIALQILHVTLHCLAGHLQERPAAEHKHFYDAIADAKVLSLAHALGSLEDILPLIHIDRPEQMCFDSLSTKPISVLYTLGWKNRKYRSAMFSYGRQAYQDDHSVWNKEKIPRSSSEGSDPQNDAIIDISGSGISVGSCNDEDVAQRWASIARSVVAAAASSPLWGVSAGNLARELDLSEESGISYRDFLKNIAAPKEQLCQDPDSLDARWYTLGLSLYGDVPILEPLEINESPTPDDLVIAIDTSGSCSGSICENFLKETFGILRDITLSRSSFRILVLLCDAKIQKEVLLSCTDEVDAFSQQITPRGFGGTDFCPVFNRIEELHQNGTLPNVRGLIYLSDGCGNYPDEAPDYPVYFFCLLDDIDWLQAHAPQWVNCYTIDPDTQTLEEVQV